MEPLTYVMAILGCADGGGTCTEVRLAQFRFQDKVQCERAIDAILPDSTDVNYPTIAARCLSERHYAAARGAKARATLATLRTFPG
jgi:hypothetical protein